MSQSQYLMAGIIAILLGLIGFSYYKRTHSTSSSPSPISSTYHQPSTSTSTTIFPTTQPYILQISTSGQIEITPRAILYSIETIFITTSTTSNQTTYAVVTPIYTYYKIPQKNDIAINFTSTTQITYNVHYGEYNIKYGGSTSTVAVYTPTPQGITYNLPVKVLNVNGSWLSTYNGTIEFPTTLVTTNVAHTHQVPIRYTYFLPSNTTSLSMPVTVHTTSLSMPITITTQVVFSLPSQVSIVSGQGNIVITVFEKNVANQFNIGTNICQSVKQHMGTAPVSCLSIYSPTTNAENSFIMNATTDIAESLGTQTGISTNSSTYIPAQHCTTFKENSVTIQNPMATYNGGKYKLEIEPQGLSFYLGNIYICSSILVQQVDIYVNATV